MSNQTPSDWQISKLYQQSFEIIKKHRVLWLFGLLLSGLTSFNLSQNFASSDINPEQWMPTNEVATTSASLATDLKTTPFNDSIYQIFINQNYGLYALIGLEILVMVIIAVTIGLIFSAWIQASALNGTQQAINKSQPTITTSSKPSFAVLKPIIWLDTIPWIIFGLILTVCYLVSISGFYYIDWPGKGLFLLLLLATFGFTIHGLIIIMLTNIWAKRLVALHHYSALSAFQIGYQLTRRYFWKMLLLGLVNNLTSWLIMLTVVGLPLGLLGGILFFLSQSPSNPEILTLAAGIILAPIIILVIIATIILSGMISAFKTSVWSLAFKQIQPGGKND